MKTISKKDINKHYPYKWFIVGAYLTSIGLVFYIGFHQGLDRNLSRSNFSNEYPFLDPSRSIVAQEHFITSLEPLRKEFNEIITKYKDEAEISIYFEYLNTGGNIAINPDSSLYPASLVKLPLAMAVIRKIEDGIWRFDSKLVLLPGDINNKSGELHKREVGTKFTVEELLKELLVNSDNTAFEILFRNLSNEDIRKIVTDTGIEFLFTDDGKVNSREYSRLFRMLYTASFLNRENSQLILRWLWEAPFNFFINSGLPEEVKFAHKWGQNNPDRVFLDSGILYIDNRPVLITAMVHIEDESLSADKLAMNIMKEIGEKAYNFVTSYKKS